MKLYVAQAHKTVLTLNGRRRIYAKLEYYDKSYDCNGIRHSTLLILKLCFYAAN
jgi:hypothetical protein